MLQNLSEEIRECYRHAEDAGRKAEATTDPFTKNDFLELERRWLFLAHSYEFTERLSRFTESFRSKARDHKKTPRL